MVGEIPCTWEQWDRWETLDGFKISSGWASSKHMRFEQKPLYLHFVPHKIWTLIHMLGPVFEPRG